MFGVNRNAIDREIVYPCRVDDRTGTSAPMCSGVIGPAIWLRCAARRWGRAVVLLRQHRTVFGGSGRLYRVGRYALWECVSVFPRDIWKVEYVGAVDVLEAAW